MKAKLLFAFLLLTVLSAGAQELVQPDTLLHNNFQTDPDDYFLTFPSGTDVQWVNFDADGYVPFCGEEGVLVPGGWYWEKDFGKFADTENSALTSCSWIADDGSLPKNNNWLILPPLYIPDNSYMLNWKSSSFSGPAFHDGYLVRVSTGSNDPFDNQYATSPLFKAGDMLSSSDPYYQSLDPSDYTFTSGYIQASTYTDTNYFDLDTIIVETPNGNDTSLYYRGRLEPHSVSLAPYSGKTIYLAFVHNARNNWMMQLDDIVVTNVTTALRPTPAPLSSFSIQPNPAHTEATVYWAFTSPQECRLSLTDPLGNVIWESEPMSAGEQSATLPVAALPAGLYYLVLRSKSGSATRKLNKI